MRDIAITYYLVMTTPNHVNFIAFCIARNAYKFDKLFQH